MIGDIPIIGEFFKHTSKTRDKRELIIVVTPYIIEERDISRSPMSDKMREWYEQESQTNETMENYDFKKPDDTEEEVVIIEKSPRVLPPPNYPSAKTTDKPFR